LADRNGHDLEEDTEVMFDALGEAMQVTSARSLALAAARRSPAA
jgi:hypothetical protein